jgi:hypothetical protein
MREKWLPETNKPAHLTVERSNEGITSAKDAVIDMYLLSCCDILLYASNSNFGFVSSLWSNSYNNIDLYPQPSKMQQFLGKIQRIGWTS